MLPIQTPPYREPALDADCHCSFISPSVDDPLHLQEIKSQVHYPTVATYTAITLNAGPQRIENKVRLLAHKWFISNVVGYITDLLHMHPEIHCGRHCNRQVTATSS